MRGGTLPPTYSFTGIDGGSLGGIGRIRLVEMRPVSDEWKIPAPHYRPSEFEVQAFLWSGLKSLGIDVRGEVRWQQKKPRIHCRFDLVIYEEAKAVRIIEVKAAPVKHKHGLHNTRQGTRYCKFGVPVTFVYGMSDAQEFLGSERHAVSHGFK